MKDCKQLTNYDFLKLGLSKNKLLLLLKLCRYCIYNDIGNKKFVSDVYMLLTSKNVVFRESNQMKHYNQIQNINNVTDIEINERKFFRLQNQVCKKSKSDWKSYGTNNYKQIILNEYMFNPATNFRGMTITNEGINVVIKGINYNLKKTQMIGEGTYGEVFLIEDKLHNCQLAVKIEIQERGDKFFRDESIIYKKLQQKNCKIIDINYIGVFKKDPYVSYHYHIMNKYEGDLNKLVGKVTPKQVLSIVNEIRKQFICLLEQDLVYADYKLANILYSCPFRNNYDNIKVYIADLGSMLIRDEEYIATYPPYEYRDGAGFFKLNTYNEKASTLSWGIGILLFNFIPNIADTIWFRYLSQISQQELSRFNKIIQDYYNLPNSNYLSSNPKTRTSLKKSLIN